MAQLDQDQWAATLAANLPPSWGTDPARWPGDLDLSSEDGGRAYGFTVVLFAERWADEMERLLVETPSLTVGDVAQTAAHHAAGTLGSWGPTGFQYGCAVSILADCWIRGDDLRRWHNLDTQISDEGARANESGGVLNPALLQMGGISDDP